MNREDQNDPLWHVIIITAAHGEKFVGTWPFAWGDEDCNLRMSQHLKAREPITLSNVRKLAVSERMQMTQTGELAAFHKSTLLVPPDAGAGPLKTFNVLATTWYIPGDEDDLTKAAITGLLAQAEKVEADNRMRLAGIVPATDIPQNLRRR